MRSSGPRAEAVPGIIDTLSAGFQTVNRVPFVLAVPVALDLFFWLGPRLSIAGLTDRLAARLGDMARDASQSAGVVGNQMGGFTDSLEQMRVTLRAVNVVTLLASRIFSIRTAVPAERGGLSGQVELGSLTQLILVALPLALLGLALTTLWLGPMGQQVRDGRLSVAELSRSLPRTWLAIVGFVGLVIGAVLGAIVPILLLAMIGQGLAPALGTFLALFAAVAVQLLTIWCVIYMRFFADAIVVSQVGPLGAAVRSVRLVSAHFWPSLGFMVITLVIMNGLDVVWRVLAQVPAGLAVAIFGNGYVESGLAAASMLFYRNRVTPELVGQG